MRIDASRAIGAYAAVTTLAVAWLMLSANAGAKGAFQFIQSRLWFFQPPPDLMARMWIFAGANS